MCHEVKLGRRVRRAQIDRAGSKADKADVFEIVRLVSQDEIPFAA